MRQINLPVDDAVYEAAKECARKSGMLFRGWVERALRTAIDRENPALKLREPA